jgi:hypothetical protein
MLIILELIFTGQNQIHTKIFFILLLMETLTFCLGGGEVGN